jgi:prophage DNA circulation protein
MGWKDDLQDASFRGVLFECTSTKDSVSKSQAAHQAPYSNKASIEDMGKDPRRISLNAVFTGENYKGELDNLRIALDETGTGELIHPIDGLCKASVLSYSVDHDAENVDTCYVAIEFMLGEDVEYQIFNPIEAIAEIDALSIVESPFDKLKAVLKNSKPSTIISFFNL